MTTHAEPRRTGGARVGLLLAILVVAVAAVAVASWRSNARVASAEPVRFAGGRSVLDREPLLAPARLATPLRVAVVRDLASASYFPEPGAADSIFARWHAALRLAGAEPVELLFDTLSARRAPVLPSDVRVLVVPSSPCLGVEASRTIAEALESGRGVVVTWLTATRDGGCVQRGWQAIASLTGAGRADTVEQRPEIYAALPAGGPLSTDMPPGARLELLSGHQVALRAPGRDAFYADFALNPEPARGQPLLDAAVVRRTHGTGRLVYWGFDLGHVAPRPWSAAIARLLVRNSVAWAAGLPLAGIVPWPNGRAAAAVLAQDVEDQFANARHAVDSLRAARVTGTFFLVTDLARRERDLVKAMDDVGEIGTHSENHRLLGGTSASQQAERLTTTQRHLVDLTGRRGAGLRPPEEQFDDATLAHWLGAGGSYVFAANNLRSAGPELFVVNGRRVVLLARTGDDDFATVKQAGIEAPQELARLYLQAYEKTRALGGLYVLSYHSNLLARAELVPALARVARALKADTSVWLTTAGDVARWWSARADLAVSPRLHSGGVDVEVRNDGRSAVEGAVLRIVLPAGARTGNVDGGRLVSDDADGVSVALPTLAPGARHAVRIALAKGAP